MWENRDYKSFLQDRFAVRTPDDSTRTFPFSIQKMRPILTQDCAANTLPAAALESLSEAVHRLNTYKRQKDQRDRSTSLVPTTALKRKSKLPFTTRNGSDWQTLGVSGTTADQNCRLISHIVQVTNRSTLSSLDTCCCCHSWPRDRYPSLRVQRDKQISGISRQVSLRKNPSIRECCGIHSHRGCTYCSLW